MNNYQQGDVAMTAQRKISSGKTELKDDYVFCWYNEEGAEIYGWTEYQGTIIKGSSGWFRTTLPEVAANVALINLQSYIP